MYSTSLSTLYMNISHTAMGLACKPHPRLRGMGVNVRSLLFTEDTFDAIVSTSTLEHFPSREDIAVSSRELCRMLKPGGQLPLTLNNLANPITALKSVLPFDLLRRLRVLPYFMGATFESGRLRRVLKEMGLEVAEVMAVMHSLRVLTVPIASMLHDHAGHERQGRFLRAQGFSDYQAIPKAFSSTTSLLFKH